MCACVQGDGHSRIGVAAGDHAVAIWPLLCGMAKSKYYLLTGEMVDAPEAERIGLLSKVVPEGQSMPEAMRVAEALARGPQHALRHTKRSLNVRSDLLIPAAPLLRLPADSDQCFVRLLPGLAQSKRWSLRHQRRAGNA